MATYSKGSLRERSKGHWQARFCRTDRNGTKIITRAIQASSKRNAELLMQNIRHDLIEEDRGSCHSTDLIDYMKEYVDNRELAGLIEGSTATNYRSSIKRIERHLSGYSIGEITSENILALQAGLLGDGLVPNTVAKDHRLIKQVLDYAASAGHIARSPFVKAVAPPKRSKAKPNPLDERSLKTLVSVLDSTGSTRQSVASLLGLYGGLRREEAAGLKWDDVDFDKDELHIRRAIGVSDNKPYLKGTKTDAGTRVVVMNKALRKALSSLREDTAPADGSCFVLGFGERYCHPERITKDFTSLAKALDLRGVTGKRATFHCLRDTFATLLISSSVNIKTVSYLLGHSNCAMTLNVYTANTPAGMESATSALNAIVH